MSHKKSKVERKRELVDMLVAEGPRTTTQLTLSIGMRPGSSGYVKRMLDELQSEGWVICELLEIKPQLPLAYWWHPTWLAVDNDYEPPADSRYDGALPF